MLGNKMMPDHKPIPEADLREMREDVAKNPWSIWRGSICLLDEIDRLREGLWEARIDNLPIAPGIHGGGTGLLQKDRGGVPPHFIFQTLEEHNARIDAMLSEGEKDVS
ncbi:hypothetical protein LCGC14_2439720 [marine sediment metagenome]|uniref:Uncharacterized protein n=1 Tax=marine sediment metagenome TaxID=412755 RepID=A0A0F9C6T0_9ZZZZ